MGAYRLLSTLVSGAILLFISGLSYLAYDKPKIFQKIFWYLVIVSFVVFISFMVWNTAISFAYNELKIFIDTKSLDAAYEKVHSIDVSFIAGLLLLSFIAYLAFLIILTSMLNSEVNNKH